MSKFCSATVEAISPYVPGEQPQDKKYIKLNTNENPYFVAKTAVSTIDEERVKNLRLYCDPEATALTNAVSSYYGVDYSNVIMTNGSDEVLAFAFLAFCKHKKTAFADVTYGFYKVYAKLFDIDFTEIPLLDDFSLNEKAFCEFDGNVVLANPNAQTGLFIDNDRLESILKSHENDLVIVDEAYADFAYSTAVKLTEKYKNLLVVGTFSKSRSLAGARLGFAIGDKALIDDLKKVKYSFNPYNINSLTQVLGEMAIRDVDYFSITRDKIVATRERLKKQLNMLGFEVPDSKANFILAKSNRISGENLYLQLKERGILVRYFSDTRISDYVRISIGTDEEIDKVINNIEEILKGVGL